VGGLKDIRAAKELSNLLAPGVQVELDSAESNFQNLLASLNKSMSKANSRKRSRESNNAMRWDNESDSNDM
jgi:hypothetical protein